MAESGMTVRHYGGGALRVHLPNGPMVEFICAEDDVERPALPGVPPSRPPSDEGGLKMYVARPRLADALTVLTGARDIETQVEADDNVGVHVLLTDYNLDLADPRIATLLAAGVPLTVHTPKPEGASDG